jgi:hypothetical protein
MLPTSLTLPPSWRRLTRLLTAPYKHGVEHERICLKRAGERRSELAGEIEAVHEALRKMVTDLENLDATIVQFDPDFKVETIKPKGFRPPSDWSNRGQMSRIILSTLRQASEPLTSRDIALQLLGRTGKRAAKGRIETSKRWLP